MKNVNKVVPTDENVIQGEKVVNKLIKRGGSTGYIILPKYTCDEDRIKANEEVRKICAEIVMNRADEGVYL
ncbi:hypothetical protein [Metaclostridioides mangenotii]|uniref:hypothetical protein n=1 Tax=Metaclostridioides mangenotii TaxID=1540 RepID=UPI0028EDA50D|nr:hypothetical protein [Clostridioides mangenotii]